MVIANFFLYFGIMLKHAERIKNPSMQVALLHSFTCYFL